MLFITTKNYLDNVYYKNLKKPKVIIKVMF